MKLRSPSPIGFTLMEIMLVVAIIALLAGLLINKTGGFLGTAKYATARADMNALKSSLLTYSIKAGTLPTTEQGLKALVTRPDSEPRPTAWEPLYDKMPVDPWKREFVYLNPGVKYPNRYDIYSVGEDGKPNTDDDIWPE